MKIILEVEKTIKQPYEIEIDDLDVAHLTEAERIEFIMETMKDIKDSPEQMETSWYTHAVGGEDSTKITKIKLVD